MKLYETKTVIQKIENKISFVQRSLQTRQNRIDVIVKEMKYYSSQLDDVFDELDKLKSHIEKTEESMETIRNSKIKDNIWLHNNTDNGNLSIAKYVFQEIANHLNVAVKFLLNTRRTPYCYYRHVIIYILKQRGILTNKQIAILLSVDRSTISWINKTITQYMDYGDKEITAIFSTVELILLNYKP